MQLKGWDEFEIGSVLFSFDEKSQDLTSKHQEDRKYSENNSFQASVAHWRVERPIFNEDHCINCFFCWIYCPDTSILARAKEVEKKGEKVMEQSMVGIDYVHCKGCGVCSNVCPTNPKSLLMVDEHDKDEDVLANWPKKDEKEK
jgi:pyruvate ferredoxin oxidoreductase delta subunit